MFARIVGRTKSVRSSSPQSVKLRKQHAKTMSKKLVNACSLCGGHCWSCGYSDSCKQWEDVAPYTPATVEVPCVRLALFQSRHDLPVSDAVFGHEVADPTDLVAMRVHVTRRLNSLVVDQGVKYLDLYVTGLTMALVEVINWCASHDVRLTLYHFDVATGEYFPQDVRI